MNDVILHPALGFVLGWAIVLMLGVVVCRFWDKWKAQGDRIEKEWLDQLRQDFPERHLGTPEFERRYDEPKFDELESVLGCPVPQAYRDLFSNSELVRRRGLVFQPPNSKALTIHHFIPADPFGQEGAWSSLEGINGSPSEHKESLLIFADGGNRWYCLALDKGNSIDNPVDVLFDYDARENIADSLSQFLSWHRPVFVGNSG